MERRKVIPSARPYLMIINLVIIVGVAFKIVFALQITLSMLADR